MKVFGGGPHHFKITVNLRGEGCDWSSDLVTQEVRAYSLTEALTLAAALPLRVWFPTEPDDPPTTHSDTNRT